MIWLASGEIITFDCSSIFKLNKGCEISSKTSSLVTGLILVEILALGAARG